MHWILFKIRENHQRIKQSVKFCLSFYSLHFKHTAMHSENNYICTTYLYSITVVTLQCKACKFYSDFLCSDISFVRTTNIVRENKHVNGKNLLATL